MAKRNNYYLLVANTLEALQHHREHIEDILNHPDLSPEERAHFETELEAIKRDELLEQEKADEKEGKGKEESGSGKSGSRSGGGKGVSKDDSGDADALNAEGNDSLSDTEMMALLFFAGENDFLDIMREEVSESSFEHAADVMLADSVGAATLFFDHEESVAHVQEPYFHDSGADHHQGAFLPLIEQHAAAHGAETLVLKVHASAVALYQRKYGYEVSPVQQRKTTLVQMRKRLTMPTNQLRPSNT